MNAMDYDAAFATFTEQAKLDKTVSQPWRNYAIKAMNEAQAFIRMGLTTTNREPDGLPVMQFAGQQCTCTELGRRKDCPAHGATAS